MNQRHNLRQKPRICYYEPDDPDLDEYVYCDECGDYVFEYCAIHGPLLVVPDDKVPAAGTFPPFVPRAALTVPRVFLHLAFSRIPDAGIGVFATLTLPQGVRFGPYVGDVVKHATSDYCWQIYDTNRRPVHVLDAGDQERSNWLRYVNCARHYSEQNLVAYQYQGQLYYRTIKLVPRFTELLVFYGSELANSLGVSLKHYNKPRPHYAHIPVKDVSLSGKSPSKKPKVDEISPAEDNTADNNFPTPTRDILDANTKEVVGMAGEKNKENKSNTGITDEKNTHEVVDIDRIELNSANSKPNDQIFYVAKQKPNSTHSYTDINTTGETFPCGICEYTTRNIRNLNSHLKAHAATKRYSCYSCAYLTTDQHTIKEHVRIHTGEKPYSCHICEKKFNHKGDLIRHMRTHTGEKPYSCYVCEKRFTQKSDLGKHMRTHTGEKPYSCNLCEKKFSHKGDLIRHIRTHTGIKPYSCNLCEKKFNHKGDLIRHIRTHTGEKPYSCNLCEKKFNHKGHLIRHIRTHTGVKPYSCNLCEKKFNHKGDLIRHIRTHTGEKPYSCYVCEKRFTQKSDLGRHMSTHTGEKPYSCNICQKKYYGKSSLNRHAIIHTGIKRYCCDKCSSGYSKKQYLVKHIQKYH